MHYNRMRTVRCSGRRKGGGCLPRGGLPRGCLPGDVSAQRGCLPRGMSAQGQGVSAGGSARGVSAQGGCVSQHALCRVGVCPSACQDTQPPPVDRILDTHL